MYRCKKLISYRPRNRCLDVAWQTYVAVLTPSRLQAKPFWKLVLAGSRMISFGSSVCLLHMEATTGYRNDLIQTNPSITVMSMLQRIAHEGRKLFLAKWGKLTSGFILVKQLCCGTR